MKNKKFIITVIVCITLVITFVLLTSYAYWRVQKSQTGTNDIAGACLSIDLVQDKDSNDNPIEGFTLEEAWPITDEEGYELTGYKFKVINNCEEEVKYQVILDSITIDNPIDFDNVKIELDDGAIKRYSDFSDATIESSNINASKKVFIGLLPGNGEATHTLRQWISADSNDNDIGKTFKSKIRVIAGQNITETLRVISAENTPVASIDNIAIGDRLSYGSEEFYVIGIEDNNVRLLSRYLLNVEHIKTDVPVGIQNRYISDPHIMLNEFYGSVAFSGDAYWVTDDDSISNDSFVYNEESNLKTYVDSYANYLKKIGLDVSDGTIMNIEEVRELCDDPIDASFLWSCPDFILGQNYWLGSIRSGGRIWTVYDYVVNHYGFHEYIFGVRPVINITLN